MKDALKSIGNVDSKPRTVTEASRLSEFRQGQLWKNEIRKQVLTLLGLSQINNIGCDFLLLF